MFTHAPTVGDAPMPMPLSLPMTTAKTAKKDAKIMKILSQVHSQRRTWRGRQSHWLWLRQRQDNCRRQSKHAIVRFVPFRCTERVWEWERGRAAVRGFVRQVNTRSPRPKPAKTETKNRRCSHHPHCHSRRSVDAACINK